MITQQRQRYTEMQERWINRVTGSDEFFNFVFLVFSARRLQGRKGNYMKFTPTRSFEFPDCFKDWVIVILVAKQKGLKKDVRGYLSIFYIVCCCNNHLYYNVFINSILLNDHICLIQHQSPPMLVM